MADEQTTPEAPSPNATPTPAPTGGTPDKTFTQAELDAIVKDRLDRQQRAITTQREKERADAEAAKLAEQGEFKKLAEAAEAKARTLEATLAARDYADLQRAVAAEHSLPADLAARLQGATREELVADAKNLAKLVTVPAAGAPPGNRPNPRPQTGPNARSVEDDLRATGRYNAL